MKCRWFWKYVVKGKGKKGLEERLEASETRGNVIRLFLEEKEEI